MIIVSQPHDYYFKKNLPADFGWISPSTVGELCLDGEK